MKVDMSPTGVTARLREMGDLWLLSVKLMNAGKQIKKSPRKTARRALEIYESIRTVLVKEWDPLNVASEPGLSDEYDPYIAPVYRILVGTRSEKDMIKCLQQIERDDLGVANTENDVMLPIVRRLLELPVDLHLDE